MFTIEDFFFIFVLCIIVFRERLKIERRKYFNQKERNGIFGKREIKIRRKKCCIWKERNIKLEGRNVVFKEGNVLFPKKEMAVDSARTQRRCSARRRNCT